MFRARIVSRPAGLGNSPKTPDTRHRALNALRAAVIRTHASGAFRERVPQGSDVIELSMLRLSHVT